MTAETMEPTASSQGDASRVRGPSPMRLGFLVLAVLLGALGLSIFKWKSTFAPPSALAALPSGAILVGVVDVGTLRTSPILAKTLEESREIPGMGKVREVCGFDPMDSVTELAFAVPATGDSGDFGLAAMTSVDDAKLLSCASKVIEARGGRAVETQIGSFRTVRDATLPVTGGEIAVRRSGPILLAGGGYLRNMIDAVEGRLESVEKSSLHARLRDELSHSSARITFVLTDEQRRMLTSQLRSKEANSAWDGLVAGGVSLELTDKANLRGLLACDRRESCARIASFLEDFRKERALDVATTLMGFGKVFEELKIKAEGEEVHLESAVPIDEATTLLSRFITLNGVRHPMPKDPLDKAPSPDQNRPSNSDPKAP